MKTGLLVPLSPQEEVGLRRIANGSFTSESKANGFSMFGFGKASNAFAASALGQANRAAMNSATEQIVARLTRLK